MKSQYLLDKTNVFKEKTNFIKKNKKNNILKTQKTKDTKKTMFQKSPG